MKRAGTNPTSARRRRGFSTAEVLVGSTLSLMALATLYSFFNAQQRALATQNVYQQSQTVTRTAVDLLSRELRMATYDPTGAAPGPGTCGFRAGIVEARPDRIRFQQDLNGDGAINASSEDLAYDIVSGALRRQDIGAGGVPITLVSGISSGGFVLQYYDNNHTELVPTGSPAALTAAQRDCVAKVRFTIKASLSRGDPSVSQTIDSQVESEVTIRNRSVQII